MKTALRVHRRQLRKIAELTALTRRGRGRPRDEDLDFAAHVAATLVQDHCVTVDAALRAVIRDAAFFRAIERHYHRLRAAGAFTPGRRYEIHPHVIGCYLRTIRPRKQRD